LFAFYCLLNAPWYLVPFALFFFGTASTGLFVVAHDCAHQSFTRNRIVNEFFGTICMMPLLFPYNCWEITHNNHHTHTNNMDRDHLWKPLTREELKKNAEMETNFGILHVWPIVLRKLHLSSCLPLCPSLHDPKKCHWSNP